MRPRAAQPDRLTRIRPLLVALVVVAVGLLILERHPARAQQPLAAGPTAMSDTDIEQFLLKARVVKTKSASKGITGSLRATLTDGTLTHDAHIQMVHEEKSTFQSNAGVELNFRDTWEYNVAGYRLDRLIGLNMVPVSVPRRWERNEASFTWWVDDVLMDEGDRLKKKLGAPDVELWNEQMQLVRVFDQLIYNTDRNVGNLLITKNWRIWAIDHTRAFRRYTTLKSAANLTRCDRQVLERLKTLDRPTLERTMTPYVGEFELKGLLARRDAIVAFFDAHPSAIFDRRAVP